MTFRIAQISDTHLSAEKPFFVGNFEQIGEALRAIRPDLVLNSGDISLSGESKESDLSAARALHEAIGLPVRFLPGNHDLGDSQDLAAHGAAVITDERRAATSRISAPTSGRSTCRAGACSPSTRSCWAAILRRPPIRRTQSSEATASLGRAQARAVPAHAAVRQGGRRARDDRPLCRSRAAPRAAGAALHCAAGADRIRPRPSISRELVGRSAPCVGALDGLRHPPTAASRSTGLKQVGYVEHRLEPDGRHESRLVKLPACRP